MLFLALLLGITLCTAKGCLRHTGDQRLEKREQVFCFVGSDMSVFWGGYNLSSSRGIPTRYAVCADKAEVKLGMGNRAPETWIRPAGRQSNVFPEASCYRGKEAAPEGEPVGMTIGVSKSLFPAISPDSSHPLREDGLKQLVSQLTKDQQEAATWRGDVVKWLSQLVQEQREVSSGQGDVIKLLKAMNDQGAQHLNDLRNLARHQSLLVENNQALLLQVSRISTHLQDLLDQAKKSNDSPASAGQ